jgi:hypothetical protein
MAIDMIVTITPLAGKEDQVEQIIIDLAAKVDKQETGALRYLPADQSGWRRRPGRVHSH